MHSFYNPPDFEIASSRHLNAKACSETVHDYAGHQDFERAGSSTRGKWPVTRTRWIWEEKELKPSCPATLPHVDSLHSAPTSDHRHLIVLKEEMGSLTPKRLKILRSQILTWKEDTCTHLKQGLISYKSVYTGLLRNWVNYVKAIYSFHILLFAIH